MSDKPETEKVRQITDGDPALKARVDELKTLGIQLNEIRQVNLQRARNLEGTAPITSIAHEIKINALLDILYDEHPTGRIEFEIAFETRFSSTLDELESHLRKAILLQAKEGK